MITFPVLMCQDLNGIELETKLNGLKKNFLIGLPFEILKCRSSLYIS